MAGHPTPTKEEEWERKIAALNPVAINHQKRRRKLIVGLGNFGKEYNWTRHNFGFLAMDFFAKTHGLEWKNAKKFSTEVADYNDLLLAKPQTFYNASGEAVQKLVQFYKIDIQRDVLVVCDDLNLDFGTMRLRASGSDGGNNGLKSIIAQLGTNFHRLRLGTNNSQKQLASDTNFVIGKFTPEEKASLPQILQKTGELIDNFKNSSQT
ncbi:MAG: aminoacyl-tRNA hydrolase [Candidatus Nomurabacteria bacterium]|jgi:PTH1 family peptidyl-tRNA hydrolase|nr:aminoacyl-tRNA hydrolase [Candidatus Nomurabacteria bacterium]